MRNPRDRRAGGALLLALSLGLTACSSRVPVSAGVPGPLARARGEGGWFGLTDGARFEGRLRSYDGRVLAIEVEGRPSLVVPFDQLISFSVRNRAAGAFLGLGAGAVVGFVAGSLMARADYERGEGDNHSEEVSLYGGARGALVGALLGLFGGGVFAWQMVYVRSPPRPAPP